MRNATSPQESDALLVEFMTLARQVHAAQTGNVGMQLGLFSLTSNKLMQGVQLGYGQADERVGEFLRKNVYLFSGAKTLHQAQELSGLLVDDNGNPRKWRAFRKQALQLHQQYNVRWLSAEYEHALASAQMAARWQDYDPETVLQYETVGDSRVRPEHMAWDHITLPASHPWWRTHYPPNGWLCRCTVIPASPTDRPTPASILPALPEPDGIFNGNVGQTGVIFPPEHPYFAQLAATELQQLERMAGQYKVSDLVQHSKSLPTMRQEGVTSALEAINKVHVLPESPTTNKTLPISFAKMKPGTLGGFRYTPLRDVPPPDLKLSAALDDAGEMGFTLLHEMGHWIDYTYLDLPRTITKYTDHVDIEHVLSAVRETKLWKSYEEILAKPFVTQRRREFLQDYLMQPYEVWARVYSQYIAEQSGNDALLAALGRGRTLPLAEQWDDEDFVPVRNAMRTLFVDKGWIPTE